MTAQHKENNFSEAKNPDLPSIKKLEKESPNIDHLIKRIMNERRNNKKKNFFIFALVLLVIFGISVFSF